MDHRLRPLLFKEPFHKSGVGDVAAHKPVTCVTGHRVEVLEVAGIRQLVQIDDLNFRHRAERRPYESGANETGPASNQNFHQA